VVEWWLTGETVRWRGGSVFGENNGARGKGVPTSALL
jgi:hypothetical protein